jgi:hypothetical protein
MIMQKEVKTDQLELLLLRIKHNVESVQIFTVPHTGTLLLHLCNVNLLDCALRLGLESLGPSAKERLLAA